jgi:hypothetical protein
MKRHRRPMSLALALLAFLASNGTARADQPSTADCLSASDASLKSDNDHHLRAERTQLLVCAAPSCPADVRRECVRRVEEVLGAIPTVIFEARDTAGNDLTAVKVTMDGETLADRLDGLAISVDPGIHTFVFESAGEAPVRKVLVVREGQKERRELISFGRSAASRSPAQATSPPPLAPPVEGTSAIGMQRWLAIAAAGVGAAALGTGAVLGAVALSKRDSARDVCPNTLCLTQDGVGAWKDAKNWGNASNVAFIVGGVGVAAGAVLWWTERAEPGGAPRAQIGLGPGMLQVSGQW